MRLVNIVDWRDAELAAAEWMRRNGWPDALATQSVADKGLDIVSDDAVAQVKWHHRPMGRPDLQKLVGAAWAHGGQALAFSRSGFSKPAVDFALDNSIGLYQISATGAVEAVVTVMLTKIDLTTKDPAEDPKVTALDRSMMALAGRAASSIGMIERMERRPLGMRQRRRLRSAQEKMQTIAAVLAEIDRRYSSHQWRRAQRAVERASAMLAQVEALLRD